MEAKLTGSAAFNMNGSTGVTERILSDLRREGSDPRGVFAPSERGGWIYLADYSYVTSTERDYIVSVINYERR
jgi:hypothetical protein